MLYAHGKDGSTILYIQAKKRNGVSAHCLLFTLSRIPGIVEAYESRPSTTKDFCQILKLENRLHFIDGDEILSILQAAVRRFSELPYELVLNLEAVPSQKGNGE